MDLLLMNAHRYVPGYLPGSNLGMNILLQLARRNGYDADMRQGFVSEILKEIDSLAENNSLPRISGFYTDFNNIKWTEKIICHLKKIAPGMIVIVGGPQASGLGEDFLLRTGADAICVGEGEVSLMELLHYYLRQQGNLQDIAGIRFIQNGEYINTPQKMAQASLDDIPWPDLSLEGEQYNRILMPILTGRGCPMGCTFCYEGANAKNVRYASSESVLKEIEKRVDSDPSLCYVNFLDDTFTLNRSRVEEICDGLKELRKRRDFVWFCSAHINTVHCSPGLISRMTDAGLRKLFFGLESGNDEMLKRYNKHTDRNMIIDTIGQCVSEGVPFIAGNFILGGPFETHETVEDSVSLVEELLTLAPGRFDTSYFTFFPYPNTPITSNPEKFGMKLYPEYIDCCLEDIPLSRTEDIDYEGMLSLRLMTNYRLQNKMRSMYQENLIPEETILETYRLQDKYHIYSRWTEYVYSHYPIDNKYWHMRACKGFVTASELTVQDDAIPVRVLSMWDEYDTQNSVLAGHHITPEELNVLTLVNGKLRLGEVIAHAGLQGISQEEVKRMMQRFEERKWILYAQV